MRKSEICRGAARTMGIVLAACAPALWSAQVGAEPIPVKPSGRATAQHILAAQTFASKFADEGKKRFTKGDFWGAYYFFCQANDQFSAPTFVLGQARAKAKMGALLEAGDLYRHVIDTKLAKNAPEPFRVAQRDAKKELDELEKRVPSVTITLANAPPEARVTMNERDIDAERLTKPISLDPGAYRISASTGKGLTVLKTVELKEGQQEVIVLAFSKPAPPPPPTIKPPSPSLTTKPPRTTKPPPKPLPPLRAGKSEYNIGALTAVAIGSAGVTIGVVSFALWGINNAGLLDQCNGKDNECQYDAEEKVALANKIAFTKLMGKVGAGAMAVGAAGLGLSIALWRSEGSEKGAPKKTLSLRPQMNGLAVSSTF